MSSEGTTVDEPFALVNDQSVRIHGRLLKVFHNPVGAVDGSKYSLEATADFNARYGQQLPVHELRKIHLDALPPQFSIMIERPQSDFKDTVLVKFRKFERDGEIRQHIALDYADWHFPTNLRDFADQLKAELETGPSKLKRVALSPSEQSIYMDCVAALSGSDDLLVKFRELDSAILAGYRKCIRSLNAPSQVVAPTSEVGGLKWWLQYVVVPLVGSGAFAALVAWLMSAGFFG